MKRTSKNQKRRGISIIWVALTFLVMLGFGGLMLDWAHVYLVGHQLHNAADASALAGARYVAWDPNSTTKITARLKALEYSTANYAAKIPVNVLLNTGNAPEGDVVIGRYAPQNRTFTPTLNTPNAMKVVTRKDGISNDRLPLLFGRMFGFTERNLIRKYAIAKIYNANGAPVIATSPDDVGIYLHGTPCINIANGGSMYANSVDIDALDLRGTPDTEVAEINVVGDVSISGSYDVNSDLDYNGEPASLNTGVDPIEDPFADLPAPALAPVSPTAPVDGSTLKITGDVHILQPGYYPGGIEITGGTITLTPGIYSVGGTSTHGGLSITGGITNATEVMFYIDGGAVDIRGNTQLTLTPPTSGTYDGISLFQSRDNHLDAEINGSGGLNMLGALYFPENHIVVSGDGDTIGTQLVADTIEIAGTGCINIPWDGSPEIAPKSYLVE